MYNVTSSLFNINGSPSDPTSYSYQKNLDLNNTSAIATRSFPAWAKNTAYVVGDIVTNNTNVYRLSYICTQAGTSSNASNWSGPTGVGTDIADGTVVWQWYDNKKPVNLNMNFSTPDNNGPRGVGTNITDTFGSALRWRNISTAQAGWKINQGYSLNYIVTNQGLNYICVAAGTSASSGPGPTGRGSNIVDGVGSLRWTFIGTTCLSWTPNTLYYVGDLLANDANWYKCIVQGTSASSGFGPTSTSASITDGTATWEYIQPWQGNTSYLTNDLVSHTWDVFQCTTGGTSGDDARVGTDSIGSTPLNSILAVDTVQGNSIRTAVHNYDIRHFLGVREGNLHNTWSGARTSTLRLGLIESNSPAYVLNPLTKSKNAAVGETVGGIWNYAQLTSPRGGLAPEFGQAFGNQLHEYAQIIAAPYLINNWLSNASYQIGRRVMSNGLEYYCKVAGVSYAYPLWTANTSYSEDQQVRTSSGLVYKCTQSGTSASSGSGPSGTGAGIVDNSCIWDFDSTAGPSGSQSYIQDGTVVWEYRPWGPRNWNNHRFLEAGYFGSVNSSVRVLFGHVLIVGAMPGMAPTEQAIAYTGKRGGRQAIGWRQFIGAGSDHGFGGVDPFTGTFLSFRGDVYDTIPSAEHGMFVKDVWFRKNILDFPQGQIQGGLHQNLTTGRIRIGNNWLERTAQGGKLESQGFQGPESQTLARLVDEWQSGTQYYSSNSSPSPGVLKIPYIKNSYGMVYRCVVNITSSDTEPSGYGGWLGDDNGRWAYVPTFVTPYWQAAHSYQIGNVVQTLANDTYICIASGTSGTTAPSGTGLTISDNSVTWRYQATLPSNSWANSTAYSLGDCIKNSNDLAYICVQSGTSGPIGNPEPAGMSTLIQDGTVLWNFYSLTSIKNWQTTTVYVQGDLVVSESSTNIYICTTSGTSSSSGSGPSGTSSSITDNSVVWKYLPMGSVLVNSNPASPLLANFSAVMDDDYQGSYVLSGRPSVTPSVNYYTFARTINHSVVEVQPPAGVINLYPRDSSSGRQEMQIIEAADSTTVINTPLTADITDYYTGRYLTFYTGVCAGLSRLITAYDPVTRKLTTDAWPEIPTNGTNLTVNSRFTAVISSSPDVLLNSWTWTQNGGDGAVVWQQGGPVRLIGDNIHPVGLYQQISLIAEEDAVNYVWKILYLGGNYESENPNDTDTLYLKFGTAPGLGDLASYPQDNVKFPASGTVLLRGGSFVVPANTTSIYVTIENLYTDSVTINNILVATEETIGLLFGLRAAVVSNPITLLPRWTPRNVLQLQSQGGLLEIGGDTNIDGSVRTSEYFIATTNAALTSTGTTISDALQLTHTFNKLTTVASGTGVILPKSEPGMRIVLDNSGANVVKVYATNDTIDGVSGSTGVNLTNGKRCEYICISANTWFSSLLGLASS